MLLSRRGNNVDTATLLIALLRASGVAARYAQAQVRASVPDVAAWVGARKPAAVEAMTAVPLLATLRGSEVDFYHVWTEAWLDNKWVSFDASFKMPVYEAGIELPVQPFDMDAFLSTQRRELAFDLYVDSVRAYLNRTFPGRGMSDVIYRGCLAATTARAENRNFPLGRASIAWRKPPAVGGCSSAIRPRSNYRRAVEEFDRVKALRQELPSEDFASYSGDPAARGASALPGW